MKVNIPVPCVDPDLIQKDGASFCLGCKKNIVKWDGTISVKEGDCVIAPNELTTFKEAGNSRITKFLIAIFFVFGAQLFSRYVTAQTDSAVSSVEIMSVKTTVIQGMIFDKKENDVGLFVDIALLENGEVKVAANSGFDGDFKLVYNGFNKDSSYTLEISTFGSSAVLILPVSLRENGFTNLGRIEFEFDRVPVTTGFIIGSIELPVKREFIKKEYTYDQFRLLKLNGQIK
jgi:hypothetical protein